MKRNLSFTPTCCREVTLVKRYASLETPWVCVIWCHRVVERDEAAHARLLDHSAPCDVRRSFEGRLDHARHRQSTHSVASGPLPFTHRTIRNRMTFKDLLLRWFLLAMMLFSLVILYHYIDRGALAERFAPRYVALTQEQGRLEASRRCDASTLRRFTENCSTLDQREVDWVLMADREYYVRRHIDPMLIYGENGAVAVCFAFAAAAIWFFWRWLKLQRFPRLRGARRAIGTLTTLAKLDERLESRRMQKANADFLTLKILFDNGLISEADFLARKNVLAASLANTASRR